MPTPPATSRAAFHSLGASSMRERVLAVIETFGAAGCISDEVLSFFPTDMKNGTVTGRYSELEDRGLIVRNGETRKNARGKPQMVMRHFTHAASLPLVTGHAAKKPRNPFVAGMMYATKVVLKSTDLDEAKRLLKAELIKAATR